MHHWTVFHPDPGTDVLLCLQLQQEQRRSSSLNDDLKAAKEQNVMVVSHRSYAGLHRQLLFATFADTACCTAAKAS